MAESPKSLRKTIKDTTFQKRLMYLLLIGLTTLLFVSDLRLSNEDAKNLLRQVWPSFLVVLMATFWYDYIIKSEAKLESELARREIEAEIKAQVEKYIKEEVKSTITKSIVVPDSECYIFRLVGRKFIKDEELLEKYIQFASGQLFDQPIYYNLVVKFFLSTIPGDSKFYQFDKMEQFDYDVRKGMFTMAVADDTEIINMLLSQVEDVDYVTGVSSIADCSIQEAFNSTELIAYIYEGSNRRRKMLAGRLLDPDDAKVALQRWDIDDKYIPKIGLIRFDISDLKGLTGFELRQKLRMRFDDHISCWFADRLTYLKRIEFDYRGISTLGRDFNVQHFFSNPLSRFTHDEQMKIASVEYDGWVIKGQGSLLAWRDL